MGTYAGAFLSEAADGQGIKVTTTSPPDGSDTAIHTVPADKIDEVSLDAYNDDTVTRVLTLAINGITDPDDLIIMPIPPQAGPIPVLRRRRLNEAVTIVATADAANVIVISGSVERITP